MYRNGLWDVPELRVPPYDAQRLPLLQRFYLGPWIPTQLRRVLTSLGIIGLGVYVRANL